MKKEKYNIKFGPFEEKYKGDIFSIKQRDAIYSNGKIERHEYCQRANSVTILPFDKEGNLLLTREFRPGANKYVWFLPTGKIDEGETSVEAAVRELREEIGLRPKNIKEIVCSPASSSYFLWDTYIFVAKDLVDDPLDPEEQFEIKVVPTPMSEAVEMAVNGIITNQFLAYYIIRLDYMINSGQFKW